jgi:hypothetical protein
MTYQNGSDAGAQVQVTGMGRDVEVIGMRGRTDPQEQSFFFKLPEEIRRQIYGELISGYTFHIRYIEAYRRMGHTRCKTKLPDTCKCLYYVRKKGVPDEWGQADLLAPLQTCRRMYSTVISTPHEWVATNPKNRYSEGIEMLYRRNTFDFESLAAVLKLSLTILPERMQMIKLVQWRYAWPIRGFWPGSFNPAIANFERKGTQTTLPWLACCSPDSPCTCIACMPTEVSTHEMV